MIAGFTNRKRFSDLSEAEILALAIASEEDDAAIYRTYAQSLRTDYPGSAAVFDGMAVEEDQHRKRLIDLFRVRFGEVIPLIRREHVAGYYARSPVWLTQIPEPGPHPVGSRRDGAHRPRNSTAPPPPAPPTPPRASCWAIWPPPKPGTKSTPSGWRAMHLSPDARASEDAGARRQFILTWVQPGLAGLMDGSVSTLAPIFATAFATQDTHTTLLVGSAAAVGAGISMGFTEAAHDDGVLSGRGSPLKRGFASGVMTMIGGLGHALPYLLPDFWTATVLAMIVVFVELWAIAWIQNRYMETPFVRAALQVVVGGALVFAAGALIGGGVMYRKGEVALSAAAAARPGATARGRGAAGRAGLSRLYEAAPFGAAVFRPRLCPRR